MSQLNAFETCLNLIRQNAIKKNSEMCPLDACLGRKLAEPVIAKISRPPVAVSAMDGYAVRLDDVASEGAKLDIIGAAPAGSPFHGTVKAGQAVRIFTGGEMPTGANHVVPQELTTSADQNVTINKAYTRAAHVRAAGIDFQEGAALIPSGTWLGSAELAIAAAANYGALRVYEPVTIALLSNGNELKPPGSTLEAGEVISSNPSALSALIQKWGAQASNLGIASDSIEAIQSHIRRAEDADIIVPIGGASVGDHDHMRAAFAELGYENIFQKVAIKPGKPTWFAKKGSQYVLGLPGNPASALVCAHLFLPSLIDADYKQKQHRASLTSPMKSNGSRINFLRAVASLTPDGVLQVAPAPSQDSSLLSPFLSANCLIRQPVDSPELAAGTLVDILMIGEL